MGDDNHVLFQGAVKMPNEIRDVKNTVIFGLTGRQLLGSGIGIAIMAVLTMLFVKILHMQGSMGVTLALIIALPAFMFGFVRPGGLDIEDWLAIQWSNNFKSNPIRKMAADNKWVDIEKIGLRKIAEQKNADEYKASGKTEKKSGKKGKTKKPAKAKKKKQKKQKSLYIFMK